MTIEVFRKEYAVWMTALGEIVTEFAEIEFAILDAISWFGGDEIARFATNNLTGLHHRAHLLGALIRQLAIDEDLQKDSLRLIELSIALVIVPL